MAAILRELMGEEFIQAYNITNDLKINGGIILGTLSAEIVVKGYRGTSYVMPIDLNFHVEFYMNDNGEQDFGCGHTVDPDVPIDVTDNIIEAINVRFANNLISYMTIQSYIA